jgi:2-polyprenyl-3-methyl-5-hydroxy-6-metoxy-1,4-benzoquinol methylase
LDACAIKFQSPFLRVADPRSGKNRGTRHLAQTVITTWSKGPADDNMPEAIIVETLEKVRRHPWWSARAKLALAILANHELHPPASVMDVGCGWGVNLQALEQAGYRVTGTDISRQILEVIDRPERRLIEADLNEPLPENRELHDGVLALDVIEHLDDDRAAVGALAKLLKPGGLAVVSVPALPELFSEFDRIQGHRRRYLPETLLAAFAGSGFESPKIFWWGAWMVPILRRLRDGQDSKPVARPKTYAEYLKVPRWPLPWLMNIAFAREQNRAITGRLTTGTSLFAVAVRTG